jgi:hypothetical protein
MDEMSRPKFLNSLLDSWQLSLKHDGAKALFPYWILFCLGIGLTLVYCLPKSFWDGSKLDVTVSAMSGLLTFNGIILALCWSAFSKIYEIVGAGSFAAHLRKHNLLNHYLAFVGYCHGTQIFAIFATAFAVAALWLPFALWFVKFAIGLCVAASIYALRQGVATSTVMQDLIWQKAGFDEANLNQKLKTVATNK